MGIVEDSIAMHGGPWGGCESCHEMERTSIEAVSGTEDEWQRQAGKWREHLATD